VFQLDASLAPVSADTADGYLSVYSALAARGEAPAGAPAVVDPEREFLPISGEHRRATLHGSREAAVTAVSRPVLAACFSRRPQGVKAFL